MDNEMALEMFAGGAAGEKEQRGWFENPTSGRGRLAWGPLRGRSLLSSQRESGGQVGIHCEGPWKCRPSSWCMG